MSGGVSNGGDVPSTPSRYDVVAFLDKNRCPKCGEHPTWSHAKINEPIIFDCPNGHRYTDRFGDLQVRMMVGDRGL